MPLDGFLQRFNQIWQDVHDQLGEVDTRPQDPKTRRIKPSKMTATSVAKQAKAFEVPLALMCYCVSSISMTLMNKYVLSSNKFKMNFLLLALQVTRLCIMKLIHGVVFCVCGVPKDVQDFKAGIVP